MLSSMDTGGLCSLQRNVIRPPKGDANSTSCSHVTSDAVLIRKTNGDKACMVTPPIRTPNAWRSAPVTSDAQSQDL